MKIKQTNNKFKTPIVIAVIGLFLMIISIFIPFTRGTEALEAEILKNPYMQNATYYTNLSMIDYAKESPDFLQTVIVAAIGGFALLNLIFTLFQKAIPSIVLTVLSSIVFGFQVFDFYFRGEIQNGFYVWGYGYYTFYIAAALSLIGGIWLLIIKIKQKNKTAEL